MALFLFLISSFGLLSALRIARAFRTRAVISTELVTKTGTLMCSTMLLSVFVGASSVFSAVSIAFSNLCCGFLLLLWCERRQIDTLKSQTPIFLDRWILNMKLGNSLSSARDAALRDSSDRFHMLLRPLFLSGANVPRTHLVLPSKILQEMKILASTSHSALVRLENLREMVRKADDFRRKSGQARRQTSIQAGVLLFLHLALAIFVYRRHGWQRHSDLIIMSFTLAAGGLIWMQFLARKSKWKI